jgi:hypothetical protein
LCFVHFFAGDLAIAVAKTGVDQLGDAGDLDIVFDFFERQLAVFVFVEAEQGGDGERVLAEGGLAKEDAVAGNDRHGDGSVGDAGDGPVAAASGGIIADDFLRPGDDELQLALGRGARGGRGLAADGAVLANDFPGFGAGAAIEGGE